MSGPWRATDVPWQTVPEAKASLSIPGIVRGATIGPTLYDRPAPVTLATIQDAATRVVAAMHEQREAEAARAVAAIERLRDAWRAAEGRPPHVDPPARTDRSQRARWLRRRAADERARDLHDMYRRLVMQVTPLTFDTTDYWGAYTLRAHMHVGFGVRSTGGLINLTGV